MNKIKNCELCGKKTEHFYVMPILEFKNICSQCYYKTLNINNPITREDF